MTQSGETTSDDVKHIPITTIKGVNPDPNQHPRDSSHLPPFRLIVSYSPDIHALVVQSACEQVSHQPLHQLLRRGACFHGSTLYLRKSCSRHSFRAYSDRIYEYPVPGIRGPPLGQHELQRQQVLFGGAIPASVTSSLFFFGLAMPFFSVHLRRANQLLIELFGVIRQPFIKRSPCLLFPHFFSSASFNYTTIHSLLPHFHRKLLFLVVYRCI
ncbi:hypothetical protein V8C35DRAFT_308047 [Trichoderma chlorosporum]